MIALIENMSTQRGKEMRDHAASRRLARRVRRARSQRHTEGTSASVEIRRLDPTGSDHAELERLAGRDSSPTRSSPRRRPARS